MTSKASTCLLISSTPSKAWSIFLGPSNKNGMVTIPTVRIPISLAVLAMIGAAPVPVPPPIPAVMNTILHPSFNIFLTSSMLSFVASRAFSGRLPAPKPSCPNWILIGIGDSCKAWLSVLHKTNVTSWIPSLYMWLAALPPPPPTPITFMILGLSCLNSNGRPPSCGILFSSCSFPVGSSWEKVKSNGSCSNILFCF